ncbi:mannitol dehydrogenase family protein [Hyphomonas johnsonii]|uniref:D-mannonate oxidoreductase n=1 Tax=Hyphomonas johnsonii MHS-2 TaxID=1280950 RepID=A0A059FSC0_9PROT|nr:mannitol dehydrogenase family protein [Hyphomonas johnsonii]KCZ93373.1 D-mannonate oxidoreductase [Hyphomonas johnsonii MHS-2]
MTRRLASDSLGVIPDNVARPEYDRAQHGSGIVHLGVGAFHKAHQAVYTDTAMALSGGNWRIDGVSLRSPAARDALVPQDGLYTVCQLQDGQQDMRIVGALRDVHVAPENPERVIALLARPSIHIVTTTITEKGYCLTPGTGTLDLAHPDISADLSNPAVPVSAIGYVGAAITRRHAVNAPVTIVSCDNLSGNGRKFQDAVLQYLELTAPTSVSWCQANVRFPCTMVDRIVPGATLDLRQRVAGALGVDDEACVAAEPFSQWVIEDIASGPLPDWAGAGAVFSREVERYELMKLRLLNAAHSAIAYLGVIGGVAHVSDAMANPGFRSMIRHMMVAEIAPILRSPKGFDVQRYIDALIDRFSNAALLHRTEQIAMDGSQKLPQRILPTLRERASQGLESPALALAVAGWIRFASGLTLEHRPIDVLDPLRPDLRRASSVSGNRRDRVAEFFSIAPIFGADIHAWAAVIDEVASALRRLECEGLDGAITAVIARK